MTENNRRREDLLLNRFWKITCPIVSVFALVVASIPTSHAATPIYTSTGGEVHYNWGTGGPPGVPADQFEAQFTQQKSLTYGDYFVQTLADDRIQVAVDGKSVIDRWTPSAGQIDRALLPSMTAGNHEVKTRYYEDYGNAAVFSDVVPMNTWLAYYYNNETLSGLPVAAKTIGPSQKQGLSVNDGYGSPVPGKVNGDHFSAKFATAKHIQAGQYILHAKADDGMRVYIDGKKVYDGWGYRGYQDDVVKVNIADQATTKDVHWVDVEYYEAAGESKLECSLTPVDSTDNTYVQNGGDVHYNWGYGSPAGFSSDYFHAKFNQTKSLAAGDYFIQTQADDGVKVNVDGNTVIDRFTPSAGQIDTAIVPGLSGGTHTIQTNYLEETGNAFVFSDIVPFDNWLAYYYNNETLSGSPVAAKTFDASADKGLHQDNGYSSPMPSVAADHFSARYVTAKRMPAGQYVLRGGADDGIRVYVDDKLVLDRWTYSAYREDAVMVPVTDNPSLPDATKNVHTIRVEYLEAAGNSKVDLTVTPSNQVTSQGTTGVFYPNTTLSGAGVVVNGMNGVAFNWGYDAPIPSIGTDHFSAAFYENKNLAAGEYFAQTLADDGVKMEVDGKSVIDRFTLSGPQINHALVGQLSQSTHQVKTSYFEEGGGAVLFSNVVPLDSWLAYYYPNQSVDGAPTATKVLPTLNENNGYGSPVNGTIPADHFAARYTTAKHMPAGNYKITTKADDGVRVYVDGTLVTDRWHDSGGDEATAVVKVQNSTTDSSSMKDVHWVEVQYYENSGNSFVNATITPTTDSVTPPPSENGAYKIAKMYKANGSVQTDYISGYSTYNEAVQAAQQQGGNAVLTNGAVTWVKDGFAYANNVDPSDPNYLTLTILAAPGSSNTLTYVVNGAELKIESVEGDWVKVRVADTVGYVEKSKIVLVPTEAASSSYFTVQSGDLYYHISHNGSYEKQLYGKAPAFLQEGQNYYSVNGHDFNGQEAYQYFQYLSIHTKTNYTADELNAYVKQVRPDSPLINLGQAFKQAEADYHVNALMLWSIAIHESDFGLSQISRNNHNLFSIRATDRDPAQNASYYATYEDSIKDMATNYVGLGSGYSNPLDWRYQGAYVGDKSTGMNVRYASDLAWGSGISSIMYQIDKKLGGKDWNAYTFVKPTDSPLNVRPDPSTGQTPLYQAKGSMILTQLSNQSGWTKIISDTASPATGSNGEPAAYVSGSYIRTVSVVK